jgi:hypothetical protein
MIWIAFLMNVGPETGWFSYVPLAGPEFSPGKRTDFWAQMITFTEVAALVVAVQLVPMILKQRAPGMTLSRMPLFLWSMLVTSFMVIFAMPAVMLASSFLISDRLIGTQFYNPAEGGDPLLWQHLFWFFGHPEVYIIFLPALGMVSHIVTTFSRRTILAYPAMVLALLANGFLAFGLWVHHMFATGLPRLGDSFYTSASMMIAIPSGLQIFAWIATIWDGKPRFRTPLLFVVGFIVIFVLGGLTGVMLAAVPLDLQVHDTYFVVAHFHYVLIGGAVFPLFGAIYFWFPKATGRMLGERLGPGTSGPSSSASTSPSSRCTCWADRHAAADLHLQGGPGLGPLEPDRLARFGADRVQHDRLHRQRGDQPAPRAPGRRQSLGGVGPGMGDQLAAAAVQFPLHAGGHRAASRCGRRRRAAGDGRRRRRRTRGAVHDRSSRPNPTSASRRRADDLASDRRHRHDGAVHRLDLPRVGAGLGRDPAGRALVGWFWPAGPTAESPATTEEGA